MDGKSYSLSTQLRGNKLTEHFRQRKLPDHECAFQAKHLFTRNCLIEPIAKMHDEDRQFYPYQWQRKLQVVQEYCTKHFGVESVTEAMLIHDFPKHFFEVTKHVATSLGEKFDGLHERVYTTIREINVVDFGQKKLYHFM